MSKTVNGLQRLILTALLAIGFALVWGAVVGWLWGGVATVLQRGAFGGSSGGPEYLRVKADGTPLLARVVGPEGLVEEYRDLEGNPVTPAADEKWLYTGYSRLRDTGSLAVLPTEWPEEF